MVESRSKQLDRVFHALGDPTRREMLRLLASGEHSIGQLATPFDMSFEGASKHVRALESAGLVGRTRVGRTYMMHLQPAHLATAEAWLRFYEHFWTEQFDNLEAVLREQDEAAE